MILYCYVYAIQINSSTQYYICQCFVYFKAASMMDPTQNVEPAEWVGPCMVLPLIGNTKILYSISFQPHEHNVGIYMCDIIYMTF